MVTLCCFLEERSAKEALKIILKRLFGTSIYCEIFAFEGKTDLEKNLERKIKFWNRPNTFFLILRDQDSGNCLEIKKKLLTIVIRTRKDSQTLIRIACHELESFYLGDLEAVEKGLEIDIKAQNAQKREKYRNPDKLLNPSHEIISLTKKKYSKIKGSRNIAPHLKLDGSNRSHSF